MYIRTQRALAVGVSGKDRDREILDLFQKGYSHQKIAEVINCPVGTVARVKRLCKEYMLSN